MSDDEVFVMIVSVGITVVAWLYWTVLLVTSRRLGHRPARARALLVFTPPVCLFGLFILLRTAASFDVRNDAGYLFFYLIFGAAWLALGRACFRFLGISWRDDVLELDNPAAAWPVAGGLAGLMACYAGSNIGDGPGWWCVGFAGGLATLVWFASWGILQRAGDLAEAITVERDENAGLRLGGFLLAAGLLCGRGAAGDWTSPGQTLAEFGDAWPLLPLLVGAAFVEFRATSHRRRQPRWGPSGPPGWPTACLYIAFAVLCLAILPGPVESPSYGDRPATGAPAHTEAPPLQ